MRRLSWIVSSMLMVVITGCGGGGGSNTSGSLSDINLDSTSMAIKGAITASVTYSNSKASSLKGVSISFTTNHPELFNNQTAETNDLGVATCVLTTKPLTAATGPTAPTEVVITVALGDLVKTSKITVKPAILNLSPPQDATYSGLGVAGSIVRVVPSGMFVTVTDGGGTPKAGVPVTFAVDSIVNGTAGDVLFWSDYPGGTVSAPGGTFTKYTDTAGQVPMQATIDVVVPSVQHVVQVVWKATCPDPDSGATITRYGTTLLTVSP